MFVGLNVCGRRRRRQFTVGAITASIASRVPEQAGDERPARVGHALRVVGVAERVLSRVGVQQRDVRVAPAAGRVGPRLRHERREVAVLLRDLLDAVLERERVVRAGEAPSGREVDLPLRPGVLAVRRDDVDADLRHLVEDPADRRHVVVPERVEDVVAGEQRLVRVAGQEVELELRPDQRLEPHRTSPLERPAEDVPGRRRERRAVVPLRVADEPRRPVGPRHDRGRLRVGEQQLIAVPALLVVEGARRPRRSACPARSSRRTCSARAPRSRRRARSGSSSTARCRACRAARTGRTRCPASASPPGSSFTSLIDRLLSSRAQPPIVDPSDRTVPGVLGYTVTACWPATDGRPPTARCRSARGRAGAVRLWPLAVPGDREGGRVGPDGHRERPHARAPAGVRSSDAGRRARRGRLGRGRGGPPVPGRDERRLDGRDPRARPARHHRRRAGPGRAARLRAQRAPHQPGAGAARARARRRRAGGVHPRPLHGERRRRERDGDPARPQLPRRAGRAGSLAGDLAGPGLPRPDDGDARADRAARACTARSARTCRKHLHIPPSTLAVRPDRRGRARGARPRARGSGAGERLRVLLRADQRRRASRATRRPCASGRGSPSDATATASSCASTRS